MNRSTSGSALLKNIYLLSSWSLVSRPVVSAPQCPCQKRLNIRVYLVCQAHRHFLSDFTSCSHAQRVPDHSVVSSIAVFLFSFSLVHVVPLTLLIYLDHSGLLLSCAVHRGMNVDSPPGTTVVCWVASRAVFPSAVSSAAPETRLHVDRSVLNPPVNPSVLTPASSQSWRLYLKRESALVPAGDPGCPLITSSRKSHASKAGLVSSPGHDLLTLKPTSLMSSDSGTVLQPP